MKLAVSNWLIRLFYIFLATDIGFMILHLIYAYSSLSLNPAFSIEQDHGYAEIFQYLKEYWIVLLVCFIAVQTRSFLYLIWSLLFFYLLLDDFFLIHEKLGEFLGQELALSNWLNLRARDFGELAVSATVGLFFLICLAAAYRFGDRLFRQISKCLIVMLFALAAFGIVVDMIHIVFESSAIDPIFTIVEDGGEMIVMSVIACFVFLLSERLHSNIPKSRSLEKILSVAELNQK